jgi:2-dehydro-3-deoxyphosphogluconate aldolase/(4S)-4-hydroxy-2-oxoglutarate aldolase
METILKTRVIPVSVIRNRDDAVPLAEALLTAGLPMIEVTFRTADAMASIGAIRKSFPEMTVGAGTILTEDQLSQAIDAGAMFAVAPGTNERVMTVANNRKLPFMPGVMTPSDIEKAMGFGFRILKFFPAELCGGARMLKALAGPYASAGVRFIPLGGVNADNARSYLELPVVAAIGGSWLVDKKLVAEGNWAEITRRTRDILEVAKDGRL